MGILCHFAAVTTETTTKLLALLRDQLFSVTITIVLIILNALKGQSSLCAPEMESFELDEESGWKGAAD